MRVYLISCIVALVIAVGAAYVLNAFQKDAQVAYTSTSVRI
jgi:hypothetical protein